MPIKGGEPSAVAAANHAGLRQWTQGTMGRDHAPPPELLALKNDAIRKICTRQLEKGQRFKQNNAGCHGKGPGGNVAAGR
jgi:hypothetical protein